MPQETNGGGMTPSAVASTYSAAATDAADKLAARESARRRPSKSAAVAAAPAAPTEGADETDVVASIAFLLRMADNFALEGNLPESVKSAETALLLRKSRAAEVQHVLDRYHQRQHAAAVGRTDGPDADDEDDEAIIPLSMDLQGKSLVLQCNSYAVAEFSHRRFDTAIFFLNKALFLTEAGAAAEDFIPQYADYVAREGVPAPDDTESFLRNLQLKGEGNGAKAAVTGSYQGPPRTSFCFSAAAEEDRLRLRAATLNNIGCMERRRGHLDEALGFLRKAIHMESQLDTTGAAAASPSSYLNLCTVLNELSLHREAVAAAQSAVVALQQQLLEQVSTVDKARVAVMLMVAQYNLGVSLERRGEKRDAEAAQKAYEQSLDTSRRYHLVAADCPTIDAAVAAVRRMKGRLPTGTHEESSRSSQRPAPTARQRHSRPSGTTLDEDDHAQRGKCGGDDIVAPVAPSIPADPQRLEESEGKEGYDSGAMWAAPAACGIAVGHADGDARLMSTTPPNYLSVDRGDSLPYCNDARAGPEVPVAAAATWHPSSLAHDAARHSASPLQPVVSLPSGSVASSTSQHSRRESAHGGGSCQDAGLSPFPPPSQPPRNLSGASLLRPPRAPQQSKGPIPPPVLAPLVGLSGVAGVSPIARVAGQDSRRTSGSVLGAAASGTGSGGYGTVNNSSVTSSKNNVNTNSAGRQFAISPPVASSTPMRMSDVISGGGSSAAAGRRLSAPSLADHSTTSNLSVVSVKNPFGRRVFGSTAMHQQQAVGSPHGSSGALFRKGSTPLQQQQGGRNGSSASTSALVSRQQQARLKELKAAAREKRTQDRQRRQQQRDQQRQAAEADNQLADALYEQMVSGMEYEELHRCHVAAIAIQRMWRGVLARAWVRTMIKAATRLQRATRVFLVKVREEHRQEALERERQRAAQEAREQAACRIIQARVRQFLRRLAIRRAYVARQKRIFYAARRIQRAYRDYGKRKQDMLAALAEAHRREDEQRAFSRKVAARRIQRAFRQFQGRKAELAAVEAQQRRSRAATTIQALVRGVLTRAWFGYYRAYRHDQAVRSAASQRKLTAIQAACRAVQSAQYCQHRRRELLVQLQQRRLTVAAVRLQCMWRQHVARIHLERLRAEKARLDRQATKIQRWYHTRQARRAFLAHCEAKRRLQAAVAVQRWVRAVWRGRKERAFAQYHAEKLREQRLMQLKQWAIPVIQGCAAAKQSDLLVASMRATFHKNETAALLWQRVGRGYAGRKLAAFDKAIAARVARQERELAVRTVAARVIQRAWRVAQAKTEVEQRRRERLAATVLARSYRCYRARLQLHELRVARQREREEKAARTIQCAYRSYCEKRRAQEMKAYYGAHHKKKLWRMRRDEAAVTVQSLWRGYVTRQAMQRVLDERRRMSRAAITIQRAWRGIAQRQTLRAEVTLRITKRTQKVTAARRIQCFWRKMCAAERVANLRQQKQEHIAKAVVLQCWWRRLQAQRELARLRKIQEEEEALAVFYAAKWERAVSLVNAFLRCRQSRLHRLQVLHDTLLHELRLEDRIRFLKRHDAAVAIQRVYRGYYERCCYRGLLREKREHDRVAAEIARRENAAAVRIQCCYRAHRARAELCTRRMQQREGALIFQEDLMASADPHQLVRELFWVRDLVKSRDTTAERVARARKHHNAALAIQKAYRFHRAHCAAATAATENREGRAAGTIRNYYDRHRAAVAVKDAQKREAAATLVQAHVRGWLVRRRWVAWRADLAETRRSRTHAADVLDTAATVIQSVWRRYAAQHEAAARRQRRAHEKEVQLREEAAALIQGAFRVHNEQHRPSVVSGPTSR